jgi:hypothetical protein
MKQTFLVLVLSVLMSSCWSSPGRQEGPGDGASSGRPSPVPAPSGGSANPRPCSAFHGQSTAELIRRREVAALVDALAAEDTISSAAVGAAGHPSPVYKEFQAIVAKATTAELVALLAHESPVVRGYVGEHIARNVGDHVKDVVALTDDETSVKTIEGCSVSVQSVGEVVRAALCFSPLPEHRAALLAVHARGGPHAAEALGCAARK